MEEAQKKVITQLIAIEHLRILCHVMSLICIIFLFNFLMLVYYFRLS